MSDVVIRVENLSKIYKLHSEKFPSLYDKVAHLLKFIFSSPQKEHSSSDSQTSTLSYIKALDDISFDVKRGEVVGIIGKNGAGKTTLLKVLAKLTSPTAGYATMKGRISTLLGLGVGFHPELSGRENIYINGVALGISKKQIDRIFDDIVSFAEISQFIDVPIKYYSSGMQMRLGFAVAAFLDSDIFLIDEVFGVGDIYFQEKALKKIEEIKKKGSATLFVSHSMNQIRRYCSRVILLDKGNIIADGPPVEIVTLYEKSGNLQKKSDNDRTPSRCFLSWEIEGKSEKGKYTVSTTKPFTIKIKIFLPEKVYVGTHGFALFSKNETLIWADRVLHFSAEPGFYMISHTFPPLNLMPSSYTLAVSLYDADKLLDFCFLTPPLIVVDTLLPNVSDNWEGLLNIKTHTTFEKIENDNK